MKKLLMLILIGLLVALCGFIAFNGFEMGKVEILSYSGIQKRNQELDEKIQESSKLAEKDFKQAINMVQESSKNLEKQKKEYEDMTVLATPEEGENVNPIQRYEVETLWVKIGNYATSEGVVIRMDVVAGNGTDMYNLKFTVTGLYVCISDFISDIENDSTLGFKIEEFKMLPSGTDSNLQATFVCKDVGIKDVSRNSVINEGVTPNPTTNTTNETTNTITSNNTTTMKNTTSNNTNVTP